MEILKRQESNPATYPDVPSGLSTAAAALSSDMLWQRIESYIAHRWSARSVTWVMQGPGAWAPDLTPATVSASEKFVNAAWESVTLDAEWNGGFYLPGDSIYRFTATVGDASPNDVPAVVEEAFRRLAEYSAEDPGSHGTASYSVSVGPISQEFDRAPTWLARAMQYSGAGDLLRPFRKVITC